MSNKGIFSGMTALYEIFISQFVFFIIQTVSQNSMHSKYKVSR